MANHPRVLKALNELLYKLDNDPEFLAQVQADMILAAIQRENKLICSVMDKNYRDASVGDMIMYGMDHDYYSKLEMEALDLFYQFHGMGD